LRFFQYGELPLVLLALLARVPLNGYELMVELDRLFGPDYVPSAGSVYPALSALEAEDLVEPIGDDTPTRFEVTVLGAEALLERHDKLIEIERRTGAFLRPQDDVTRAMDRLWSSVRSASGLVDPNEVLKVLRRTDKQIQVLIENKGESA
jgi:DNA-binding PadR family transcriptional regulator